MPQLSELEAMLSKIGEEIAKLKKSDEEKAICSSYSQQPANVILPSTSFQSDNEKAICSNFSHQFQTVSQLSTSFQSVEDKAIYSNHSQQLTNVSHPSTSFQSNEKKAICSSSFQKPFNVSQLSANSQYTVLDLDSKSYAFNQNNLSKKKLQSSSPNLLTDFQFVDVDENQESYYSKSYSHISGNDDVGDQVKLKDPSFPQWIMHVHKEDQFKKVFFNSSKFDIKLFFVKSSFFDWYNGKLNTTSWKEFNSNINDLAEVCVKQLETFYSTKQKPKETRMMHSTERHHLSAVVAFQLPQLVSKYIEFQFQFEQKILDCSQSKSSPIYSTFMEFFFYKVSKRMDYSYRTKNDQDRKEVPLRKPQVSEAMKRNNPRQVKKLKVHS